MKKSIPKISNFVVVLSVFVFLLMVNVKTTISQLEQPSLENNEKSIKVLISVPTGGWYAEIDRIYQTKDTILAISELYPPSPFSGTTQAFCWIKDEVILNYSDLPIINYVIFHSENYKGNKESIKTRYNRNYRFISNYYEIKDKIKGSKLLYDRCKKIEPRLFKVSRRVIKIYHEEAFELKIKEIYQVDKEIWVISEYEYTREEFSMNTIVEDSIRIDAPDLPVRYIYIDKNYGIEYYGGLHYTYNNYDEIKDELRKGILLYKAPTDK